MAFQIIGYESDSGEIFNMRVAEETVAAAGGSAGAATIDAFVKITKSDREFGIRPRYLVLSQEFETSGGRSFKTYKRLPMATVAAFNAAARGSEITIGGVTYEVVGKEPEDY